MAASLSAYRLTDSVIAIDGNHTRKRLKCLSAGSIVIPMSRADGTGMIKATCEGLAVVIFRRDLEERSVEITESGSFEAVKGDSPSERLSPPSAWQLAKRNV